MFFFIISEMFLFFLFLITAYVSFYVPGMLVLEFAGSKISKSIRFILSWGLGLSFFLLLIYLSSWMHVAYLPLFILVFLSIYVVWKRSGILLLPKLHDYWSMVIVLFGSFAFMGMTFLSGLTTNKGMQFIGTVNNKDGLMHMAYIKMLNYTFPPVHAGLAGYPLRGYHYFYDLLLSRFSIFYHFTPEDLHYRLFPLFMSLLYGAAFYLIATLLTNKKAAIRLTLFFAYFGQSFAYVLSVLGLNFSPANGFGVVQPLELILDPSVILSIALMLSGFYLVLNMNKSVKTAILAGLILGILSELKVYAGITAIITLCIYAVYLAWLKKASIIPIGTAVITTGLVTAITFLPNNLNAGSLQFALLFPYESFMQEKFIDNWHWEIIKTIYWEHHNIFRLVQMYGEAVLIFWFLTLGSRVIIVCGVVKMFRRSFWKNKAAVLIFLLILIPILIASLFVQSISIFDTKQFFWISVALMSIPAGVVYSQLFERVPAWGKVMLVCVLIFLSWGGFFFNENVYIFHPKFQVITKKELAITSIASKNVSEKSFIVVIPKHEKNPTKIEDLHWYPATYISGLTGRITYYEPEVAQYPLQTVFETRQKAILKLATLIGSCNLKQASHLVKAIGTKYLVGFNPISCNNTVSFISLSANSNTMSFYVWK